MAQVDDHTPFTPGWIDIGTDVDGAKSFYSALFDWETVDAGPPEETGGYGFFLKGGRMVAGYGPQQNPGPPVWATYVIVPDAEDVATKVAAAGGQVVLPPMDVMDQGRMGVFQDAGGAFFSVWQPGQHRGAQLVKEHGSFTWAELDTRDVEGAKAFYDAVFGWGAETSEGGGMVYTEFKLGGESIGGMMDMPPMVPAEAPAFWMVYLHVDDVDASSARATELGGTVVSEPMDFPGGRFSLVQDPQGAMFGLMSNSPSATA